MLHFIKRFNISTVFLHFNPDVWNEDMDFLKVQNIVKHLKIVNDTAERSIILMEDYKVSSNG